MSTEASEQVEVDGRFWRDRGRAEAFGAVAEDYDRYRPVYPPRLLDDLADLAGPGGRVLDVGCGTGKAGVALAARGLDVLGVEIDARMAEVARSHGLPVEVAPFEQWEPHGRQFDLVTSGQAWHWVDPDAGVSKAAEVVRPGSWLALFWNSDRFGPPAQPMFEQVYSEHAPELLGSVASRGRRGEELDLTRYRARFVEVQSRIYYWQHTYATAEWLAVVQTHSDHVRLDPERRARLVEALGAGIDALGGSLVSEGGTFVLLARTADSADHPDVAG